MAALTVPTEPIPTPPVRDVVPAAFPYSPQQVASVPLRPILPARDELTQANSNEINELKSELRSMQLRQERLLDRILVAERHESQRAAQLRFAKAMESKANEARFNTTEARLHEAKKGGAYSHEAKRLEPLYVPDAKLLPILPKKKETNPVFSFY